MPLNDPGGSGFVKSVMIQEGLTCHIKRNLLAVVLANCQACRATEFPRVLSNQVGQVEVCHEFTEVWRKIVICYDRAASANIRVANNQVGFCFNQDASKMTRMFFVKLY